MFYSLYNGVQYECFRLIVKIIKIKGNDAIPGLKNKVLKYQDYKIVKLMFLRDNFEELT